MQNDQFCNVNIRYDSTEVLTTRLRIGDIDDTVISECVKTVRVARNADIRLMKESVEPTDQWFGEDDPAFDMFDPMERLFSTITEFQPASGDPSRPTSVFRFSPKKLVDFSFMGFPELAPDIQAVEYRASKGDFYRWNDRDCFGEIKPSDKQGPKGQDDGASVPKIVLQTSDYARHYLTCRPLLLFCVGLLIFGTRFCVGIYDRQGVVFSTIHDMFDEMDIFVRVVRSLTHVLSIQELGLDPTIEILTDEETTAQIGEPQEVPSAVIPVSPTGLSTTYWCTVGRPTWASSSLVGRGITVWTVKQCHRKTFAKRNTSPNEETPVEEWVLSNHIPMALKSSWRSNLSQTTESEMYRYLQTTLADCPGLAKFQLGGDVHFPGSNTQASMKPITVRNLRQYPNCSDLAPPHTEPTLVLHRLVLGTVGEHLWNYDNDLHLLRRSRDALLTHKALTERGFLHRDVNPGNILPVRAKGRSEHNDEHEIILAGVEYALITAAPFVKTTQVQDERSGETLTQTHIKFEGHSAVGRGRVMTGNTQFMARELLMSHLAGAAEVEHEVHHDIESFIWSMLYCVMRHIAEQYQPGKSDLASKDQWDLFLESFAQAFAQPLIRNIMQQRRAESVAITYLRDPSITPIVDAFVSATVQRLILESLNDLLYKARDRGPLGVSTFRMAYDSVLEPISEAVHELEMIASGSAA